MTVLNTLKERSNKHKNNIYLFIYPLKRLSFMLAAILLRNDKRIIDLSNVQNKYKHIWKNQLS